MGFFKAITFITLWVLLSFFWVSLGQGQGRCASYGEMEGWLKAHPELKSWLRFYVERQNCAVDEEAFLKTLAASEPLSIKLNQAKVTFEQFYVPLYHLLSVENWEALGGESAQSIQSDLSLINHSLKKAMETMNLADQDYFRAVVLLDLPSEFGQKGTEANGSGLLSGRINRDTLSRRPRMDTRDVVAPPYERVFAIEK